MGIVLAGDGSDGSVGLAHIKEQGGITLVPQPEDAQHDTMPRSAIATGAVDIILPVAEMPRRLKRITGNMSRIHMPAPVGGPFEADDRPAAGYPDLRHRH